MIVAVNIFPFVFEVFLFIIFLGILAIRGTRKDKIPLLVIFLIVIIFTVFSLYDALSWYSIPLSPPPEVWSEPYGDGLFMREFAYNTALFQSILFLILSILFIGVKSIEER